MSAQYFKESEISGLVPELVRMADIARGKAGIPFVVTSGYRSPTHNAEAGGVADSAHTTGEAMDIRLTNSNDLFRYLEGALYAGFHRIVVGVKLNPATGELVYHNFHMDTSKSLPQNLVSVKLYPWS